MSFWMVNYVCSLVLWDNLVCVFYVFFFIFHFTRRPMSFMSLWTHALGVNLDAPEIAETFFSKKQHGLLNLLCFCVVRVTSDRKCLWQYQLECKMGEGLNHLTERRRICIESCLLISHPRHQLPCHFVDGRQHCCEHERHEFHVDCQSSRFSMTVGDATMWCAWSRHYRLWRSKLDQNLTHVCEIRTDHQCYQLRSVVALIEIVWTCLNCYLACHNSLQVKRHVRFERLGDDLHSVKTRAVQAFYLRWRSENLRNLTVLWCFFFRIVTKGCGGESFRCTSWSHKASWIED